MLAQGDAMTDFTTIHPLSASMAHHLDIHLWRGAPLNQRADRPVQILVNHGYVVGFSPTTLQPAWSAYSVARASAAADYKRPLHYYSDVRLDPTLRLSNKTFGKIGDIGLDVGHMTPNEVINRQFGRLAQAETFLMSNMSPQYSALNQGVWVKLEEAIRTVQTAPVQDEKDHGYLWVIVGPILGENPQSVSRDGGKVVPIPEAYFAIVVEPEDYPFQTEGAVKLDCFIIPQTAPRSSNPDEYPATLEQIEKRTGLVFFDSWARTYALGQREAGAITQRSESRLQRAFGALRDEWKRTFDSVEAAQPVATTIDGLIDALKNEAERSSEQVREEKRQTRPDEKARAAALQHTLSWLLRAKEIADGTLKDDGGPLADPSPVAPTPAPAQTGANIITYKIIDDIGDRLKNGARAACNFWNRFLVPGYSVVIRLGTFTHAGNIIARAYEPYEKDGVMYGAVEFNTAKLLTYTPDEISGTIIHEIGHTLGIGWKTWSGLFDRDTGKFLDNAIQRFAALAGMEVERGGGDGTALAHWDEELFGRELMTGYKNPGGEHVLPITIAVMEALGHSVSEQLKVQTSLEELLQGIASMVFSRQDEVRQIDLDHFEPTEVRETVPHEPQPDPVSG